MPKTRAEVDALWEPLHSKLTKLFYQDKAIDKELFEKAHAVIWLLHEQESIQNGVLSDFGVDEVTHKMRSQQITEMLAVLKTTDVDALIVQLRSKPS